MSTIVSTSKRFELGNMKLIKLNHLMNFLLLVSFLCHQEVQARETEWGDWSECSATCGKGVRRREKLCSVQDTSCRKSGFEVERCYEKLCPSYLDWPRIHFRGKAVIDAASANNYRCTYDNDRFCPYCDTLRYPVVDKESIPHTDLPKYVTHSNNSYSFNPHGTLHFYFQSTVVTSACWHRGKRCVKTDPIVGRAVKGVSPGRIVDLDVDWQFAPEIIGYDIHIPGVLTAHMMPAIAYQETKRVIGPSPATDVAVMTAFKSKLVKLKWLDSYFKEKFRKAKSLSIYFSLDLFKFNTSSGRIFGTIGMTSSDDSVNSYAGRVMRPHQPDFKKEIPFNLDAKEKVFLVDLTTNTRCLINGSFNISKRFRRHMDVVVFPTTPKKLCDSPNFDCAMRSVSCDGKQLYLLTLGGALDYVQKSNKWITQQGGIVHVSIDWADSTVVDVLTHSRIGIVHRKQINSENVQRSDAPVYSLCHMFPLRCRTISKIKTSVGCNIMAMEAPMGANFKPLNRFTERKAAGDIWRFPVIASSFGRPLSGVYLSLKNMKMAKLFHTCSAQKPCGPYASIPHSALDLGKPALSNEDGIADLEVKIIHSPGSPRKCGIDGQTNTIVNLAEGSMFDNVLDVNTKQSAIKQCGLKEAYNAVETILKVFDSLPNSVMQKTCPTWTEDVRPIFQRYYNMFPVMTRNDIINLRNINDIRTKLRKINMTMFSLEWEHPNFMPTTRDLSPDKTELIRRWLECEMNGIKTERRVPRSDVMIDQVCGRAGQLDATLERLRQHIQGGIWVELYTIPPYMTALFSLKHNHHKAAHTLLKSVATEEMLHIALNANVLNSIGGKPNLTDSFWLPVYPTAFPSASFYQLIPGLILRLEKFSKSLLQDFLEIEKPAPPEVLEVLQTIAQIWKLLPEDQKSHDFDITENTHRHRWVNEGVNGRNNQVDKILNSANGTFWSNLFQLASNLLLTPTIKDAYTIGAYYAHVILELIQTEACVKTKSAALTIFTGNQSKQLGMDKWYITKGTSSANLLTVRGLKSAVAALMEIVYEGEGGTPCGPYVEALSKDLTPKQYLMDKDIGRLSPWLEKTHYIKFKEMVQERELIPVPQINSGWPEDSCLQEVTGCDNTTQYCYRGKSLAVRERDIWPVYHNWYRMQHYDGIKPNEVQPKVHRLLNHFDSIYTSMLHCLEITFNEDPNKIASCNGNMYELLDAGKKLARTSIRQNSRSDVGPNATPRWLYVKDPYKQEGLNTVDNDVKTEFC